MAERATLAEHDALPFRPSARHAHPADLAHWQGRGWIRIDIDSDCFRLTDSGKARVRQCCGTCASWDHLRDNYGDCRSPDRLDGQPGSAGVTYEYDVCEAWILRATASDAGESR